MQTKTWMDSAPQYYQNILTDHPQKRHGSLGNNKNIWHNNKNRTRTLRNSKSLKSTLLCMLVLVTTKITKIHGEHPCKDNMALYKTHVELRIIECTH